MAKSTFRSIRIVGIAASVPRGRTNILTDHEFVPAEDRAKIAALTGVREYRKSTPEVCSSDLCKKAAASLIREADIDPKTIDAVVFATMTPDYRVPSTACILAHELGLDSHALAYDVNMGCSGYVVGMYNACSLIRGAGLKRVLLLAGDTQTKLCHPKDKNVVFLLGDGGTATLLEADEDEGDAIRMELKTDGSRFKSLYVPAGGFRTPSTDATRELRQRPDGGVRADDNLYMDGMEIFKFSSTDVVNTIQGFMDAEGIKPDETDYLILHQANKFMNDKIARKLKFPAEKVLYSIGVFGNTGSASIPLTIVHNRTSFVGKKGVRSVISGFGVGLSWGVGHVVLDNIVCPPIEEC